MQHNGCRLGNNLKRASVTRIRAHSNPINSSIGINGFRGSLLLHFSHYTLFECNSVVISLHHRGKSEPWCQQQSYIKTLLLLSTLNCRRCQNQRIFYLKKNFLSRNRRINDVKSCVCVCVSKVIIVSIEIVYPDLLSPEPQTEGPHFNKKGYNQKKEIQDHGVNFSKKKKPKAIFLRTDSVSL